MAGISSSVRLVLRISTMLLTILRSIIGSALHQVCSCFKTWPTLIMNVMPCSQAGSTSTWLSRACLTLSNPFNKGVFQGVFRMILSNLKQPHQFNKRPHPSYDFVPGGGELIIGHMRRKIRNISQITPMIMAVPISTLLFESTLTGDGIWRENTLESYLHYWLEYVFSFKQGIDYWGCCEQLNSYWTNGVRFMGLISFTRNHLAKKLNPYT